EQAALKERLTVPAAPALNVARVEQTSPAARTARLSQTTAQEPASHAPSSAQYGILNRMQANSRLRKLVPQLWKFVDTIGTNRDEYMSAVGKGKILIGAEELRDLQQRLRDAKFRDSKGNLIEADGGVGPQMWEVMASLKTGTRAFQREINRTA